MDEVIKSINEAPNVFYQGIQWKLWHDKKQREGQLQIDIDNFLLEQYCFNNIPPVIRLWQTNPCLVLSKFDTRYSQFKTTKAVFAENNIPLYIRSTGGTVVPQGPGVLNISLIFSSGEKFTHQNAYLLLCNFVASALLKLNVHAEVAEVSGAFCDGRYNLTIGGRKVGGTAQQIKINANGVKQFLSHMCLMLDVDILEMITLLKKFYTGCGVIYPLHFDNMTSLASELPLACTRNELINELLGYFDEVLTHQ